MTRFFQLSVLGLIIMFAAASFGQAPPAPQAPPPDRMRQLSQQLNLTDEQREKVRPLFKEEADQVQALNDNAALSREQKFIKLAQIRDNTLQQIRPLLGEDQQKKLDALRKQTQLRPAGRSPQKRNEIQRDN